MRQRNNKHKQVVCRYDVDRIEPDDLGISDHEGELFK